VLAKVIKFKKMGDRRGLLIALEENKNIPFNIKRVYYIIETKNGVRRGFHAHKKLEQVAICVTGSCSLLLDNGKSKESVLLNSSENGLIINKMVWHEMYDFSKNCVLIVLASDFYDESDYIRNYDDFLKEVDHNS